MTTHLPLAAASSFGGLLQTQPLIFIHLASALGALLIGGLVLLRRKGNVDHRRWGWAWVLMMGSATLTSAFILDHRLPNIAGFTPIHALTAFVAVQLPRGVWLARQGRVAAHRQTMRGLYIGGCLLAGLFTLLPGRFLGRMLWPALGLA